MTVRRSSRLAAVTANRAKSNPSKRTKTPNRSSGKHKHDRPASFVYEFGGPIGALSTSIALPLVCYAFVHLCDDTHCPNMNKITHLLSDPLASASTALQAFPTSCTLQGFAVVFGWFVFQLALERFLPGPTSPGTVLKDGKRLVYNLNGHLAYWVSMVVVVLWQATFVCQSPGSYPTYFNLNENDAMNTMCATLTTLVPYQLSSMSWLEEHFIELLTASLVLSTTMSLVLYVHSLRLEKGHLEVAAGGDSGIAVYDFFMGRELNPRPLGKDSTFDLKYFCELRPGLIGWCVLNFGMLCSQLEQPQGIATGSMVLINVFQLLYVWDALYNERAILTTMDITTDGFGMMLAFGDLTWVPFTYSLQSRYLVHHDPLLSHATLCFIVGVKILGYTAFRGSNGEKDRFRTNPNDPTVQHLETITTKTGRKLLISGWWGMARKINYSADWLMGLSWCAVCGIGSIIPYFYSIYFAILLIHRAWRDDHACHDKYGASWLLYKKKVPYVFIPGIV